MKVKVKGCGSKLRSINFGKSFFFLAARAVFSLFGAQMRKGTPACAHVGAGMIVAVTVYIVVRTIGE